MRVDSDEKYVLDLIAEVLMEEYTWQKRFETLRGDPGKRIGAKLPVDAYFPLRNLIIEFREKQHYSSVPIMDNRMTISGVCRREQRKLYDLRKEEWARNNGVSFLEIPYFNLDHCSNGKLRRNIEYDKVVIERLLMLNQV